jgi:imidazolonepropionase-like amidohydrolase
LNTIHFKRKIKCLISGIFLLQFSFNVLAHGEGTTPSTPTSTSPLTSNKYENKAPALIIRAGAIFDGTTFIEGEHDILIQKGKITKIGAINTIRANGARVIKIPEGTILPGFIDMHTHHLINDVPPLRILQHGVTTARDLGSAEPITGAVIDKKPYQLRQFYSGPILQAPGGYPNVAFPGSGVEVSGDSTVRAKVDSLVAQGASVIAVSIDDGLETGAPWHWHMPASPPPWPTLSDADLLSIVDQAHKKGLKVTAYFGNDAGAQRALSSGVDEWAHMPCELLSGSVIAEAGRKKIAIDTTIDTFVECQGVHENSDLLLGAGAQLFYGTDMGHLDIPHGIDSNEIHMLLHAGFHNGLEYVPSLTKALIAATSAPATYLGLAPLGQITTNAPADIVVIGGDVRDNFKALEYPRLVVKNGYVVINRLAGE